MGTRSLLVTGLACLVFVGAFFFGWYMFTRNQPHLPTEPEYTYMQFHSESGWYYSYYNRLALDETTASGLENMFRNNETEYPDVVNSFARFNLMQELVFGMVKLRSDRFDRCLAFANSPCGFSPAHGFAIAGVPIRGIEFGAGVQGRAVLFALPPVDSRGLTV